MIIMMSYVDVHHPHRQHPHPHPHPYLHRCHPHCDHRHDVCMLGNLALAKSRPDRPLLHRVLLLEEQEERKGDGDGDGKE